MTPLNVSWENVSQLPTLEVLSMIFLLAATLKFIQFNWNMRRFYKASFEVPGPFSFLPVFNTWILFLPPSKLFRVFIGLFDRYPDKFRIWLGKHLLYVISKPEDLAIILTSPKCIHKNFVYDFTRPYVGNGIFTAPVSVWKVHRRSMIPAFSQKNLNEFVETFVKHGNALIEKFKSVAGRGEFELPDYIAACIVDIFLETVLGTENESYTDGSILAKYTEQGFQNVFRRIFCIPYYIDAIYKLSATYKEEQKIISYLNTLTQKLVREKKLAYESHKKEIEDRLIAPLEEAKKHKSLLDLLIEVSCNEGKFSEREVMDEMNTALIAGTDTSTSANSFVYMTLGMHQDIQEKVYKEVIDVVGHERDIQADDLPKLQYTERVIKETQRLFPLVSVLARLVMEDTELDSCVLRAGTSVVIGLLHVHRNPKYWPDPLKFDPDRFLPEEVSKRHPFTYMPFSAGPRNCIGMRYAMMAMKTLTAQVVRRYRIFSEYKSIEEINLSSDNIVLRPEQGYKVSLELR